MRVPLAGLPLKRRVALVLSTAVGFTLGGLVVGASTLFDMTLLGFAVMGGLGGYALGWAAPGGPQRMILAGFLGFLAGMAVPLYLVSVLGEPPGAKVVVGAVGGALGGGALGFAWAGPRTIAPFALGGALGWAAGFPLTDLWGGGLVCGGATCGVFDQATFAMTIFAMAGLVGGLGVGAGAAWADARTR